MCRYLHKRATYEGYEAPYFQAWHEKYPLLHLRGSVIGKLSESYRTNGSEQPSYPILSNRVTARKLAVTTASFLTVTYVSHTCINTYTLK